MDLYIKTLQKHCKNIKSMYNINSYLIQVTVFLQINRGSKMEIIYKLTPIKHDTLEHFKSIEFYSLEELASHIFKFKDDEMFRDYMRNIADLASLQEQLTADLDGFDNFKSNANHVGFMLTLSK